MKPRILVLLLAAAALLAKLYCAATTIGSSDVVFFWKFAHIIQRDGLLAMYRATVFFNHTPLVGWFSEAALRLSGGEQRLFAFYLRLPAIFADFFAVLALLWLREKTGRPAWWALALFAASPVAFMVSGYHGNVDSVMALGILCAAAACATNRPALCGLWLGLACNIKIIPLLLAPVFFFLWWQRGKTWRFSIPAVLTVLIGWSYPLLTIPAIFLKNVLGYGSVWGVWGITYGLRMTDLPALRSIAFTETTPAQAAIMQGLKLLIVAAVLALAWRRRKVADLEVFHTLALAWAVFFVFAPGFGAQYLAWFAPCFLVASERWYAALTAASSIALFVFYNAISHGMPWNTGFTVHSTAPQWVGWLVLPWLIFVAYLGWQARFAFAPAKVEAIPEPIAA
jgi:uncharacterized membrane protein